MTRAEPANSSARVDVRAWLASRTPAAPKALENRIAEITKACPPTDLRELPGVLVDCATGLLSDLSTDRDAAIELLAADALITYAMEAAAEVEGSIDAVATAAMARIAT